MAVFFICFLKATQYLFHKVLYTMRRCSGKIADTNDDPKWEFSVMGFSLRRIHPSTILYFVKVLNYKLQEFAHINQVAQEIWGGAVLCLSIWKSTLLREMLHGAHAVSDSLVRTLDIWNVGMLAKQVGYYPKCSY